MSTIGHRVQTTSTALPEPERRAKLILDLRHYAEWAQNIELTWLLWEAADEIEYWHVATTPKQPWWRFW